MEFVTYGLGPLGFFTVGVLYINIELRRINLGNVKIKVVPV